jgi:hypothetical protein
MITHKIRVWVLYSQKMRRLSLGRHKGSLSKEYLLLWGTRRAATFKDKILVVYSKLTLVEFHKTHSIRLLSKLERLGMSLLRFLSSKVTKLLLAIKETYLDQVRQLTKPRLALPIKTLPLQ